MITITNKLVLFILFSPVSTTVDASSMLNNIVETIMNNIVRSTTLFSHDNSVVTPLFNQQYCNNLYYIFLAV